MGGPADGDELDPWRLRGGFALLDLSCEPQAEIEARVKNAHLRLGLLLLKNVDAEDVWDRLAEWAGMWAEVSRMEDGLERIQAVLRYLGEVVGRPPEPTLQRLVQQLPEPTQEAIMTWAESLRREGEERGRREGEERGRREGEERGRREGEEHAVRRTLARLLRVRFGGLPHWATTRLAEAEVAQLEAWTEAVLSAESLEDVLGG